MPPQIGRDPLAEARQARRSAPFRARAKRDLEEVRRDDDPRIKVFAPDTVDVPHEFCLVLTPYAGPWKGLQLHFTVQWDLEGERQWPAFSPRIFLDPGIKHPCFPTGVINPGGVGRYDKVIDVVAENGRKERYEMRQNPFDTLQAFFTKVLHIFSASKLFHHINHRRFLCIMKEATIASYLDEEGYAALQHPGIDRLPCCQKIPGCCTCGQETSSLQDLRKALWESDSRPDIELSLDDSQPSNLPKHTVHKVKTLEPEVGRLHRFEYATAHWLSTLQSISSTVCANCPYGSSALPCIAPLIVWHASPPDSLLVPPSLCKLDTLTYDNLLEIARWLETSTLHLFGTAYPRFDELIPHLLQTRELKCTLLRKPYGYYSNAILGARFNAHPEGETRRYFVFLESFELHDSEVHAEYHTGAPHEYPVLFLPLAFTAEHFGRAQKEIQKHWAAVDEIIASGDPMLSSRECGFCKGRHGPRCLPDFSKRWKPKDRTLHRIRAIIALMEAAATHHVSHLNPAPFYRIRQQVDQSEADKSNDGEESERDGDGEDNDERLGTEFARSGRSVLTLDGPDAEGEAAREREQSITWYCHLLHLVLSICRTHPEIISEAKSTIQSYIESPSRSDEQTFTVHNILVLLMVVSILEPDPQLSWSPFNSPFLRKVFSDHVQEKIPVLLVKEEGYSLFRLIKTFQHLKWRLRSFIQHLALVRALAETYAGNVERLDRNCGFVDPQLRERVVREIQLGNRVRTWRELFRLVGFEEGERLGEARFCEMLREMLPDVNGETAPTLKKNRKRGRVVDIPLEERRKEAESLFEIKAIW